ncbi:hypothetical protein BN2475_670021 [Paraburkholderia ribeironis]|uniref:Uncharacterized protein n=1 Tax=Paraburkholderia ribeironis TaxID=1247936 RepID=A0A1N7SGW1_9BURK|nr:hypothetical protein BN2475_670021 [Paraburkholderia ribeironis]
MARGVIPTMTPNIFTQTSNDIENHDCKMGMTIDFLSKSGSSPLLRPGQFNVNAPRCGPSPKLLSHHRMELR